MRPQRKIVLIAEDDPDDRLLLREAFAERQYDVPLHFVNDGVELIDYLVEVGEGNGQWPSLILLDINMPRMNGLQALERIKSHSRMRSIPCAMLSTSTSPDMVSLAYRLGASSYFQKPATFEEMVELAGVIHLSWLSLPHNLVGAAQAVTLNYFNKDRSE
jgi:CheY-like chemotaxis protein